ncbi:hypothetical protein WICMUC_004749 [Wickerhamomyces mucosus]|uniref:Autophagy-related protein 17 n=1 Tax=Wickerhamomyces mucosus TaxID=1378264 RepID=A0A9P8PH90_9ASCO|nr:hypothetical protein WICMUC_004749 [Wickerhamomyces mucosus]
MEKKAEEWAKDATEKLKYAERVGEKANTLLTATKDTVRVHDERLIKGNFLLDSIDQQLQLLETIRNSIHMSINRKQQASTQTSNQLANSIDELELEYDDLKQVHVDKALNSSSKRLYDLVTTDILKQLKSKDMEINDVCTNIIEELKEQDYVLNNKIKLFTKEYDKLESEITVFNEIQWLDTLIEENNQFEEEIASLIESVTIHYDQCVRGLMVVQGKLTIPLQEKEELFDILAKDFVEVPNVISDIEEIFSDIENRCDKVNSFVKNQALYLRLQSLFKQLISFGEHDLSDILALMTRHSKNFDTILSETYLTCEECTALIQHYKKFKKSYYSLLLELQRRSDIRAKLESVLRDTENKLKSIQEEDFRYRNSFLKNNGAFLPSDLYLGINDIESPLYHLKCDLFDIPSFDKSVLPLAKKIVQDLN